VQCLVEFEKIIISLDFCFFSAMEKKGNTILITMTQNGVSTLIKVKKLTYNKKITSAQPPSKQHILFKQKKGSKLLPFLH
jgi:hypothetical protein